MKEKFLSTNFKEMQNKGHNEVDFVIVTGDAYVDHPSFGTSLIGRYLESFGYTVAIIAQPNFRDSKSITICKEPRLAFLVSSGNIDSMVNHYYVSKNKRKIDVYTPNNVNSIRPDYATTVYSKLIKIEYPNIPIIVGGIEASLRRLAHYDYWKDRILPSVLVDSQADLLVYSMGERAIIEIADYLSSGLSIKDLTFIQGTCYLTKDVSNLNDYILLPDFSSIRKQKDKYAQSFNIQYQNNENQSAQGIIETYDDYYIVQNIPQPVLTSQELDHLYDLPFTYESYDEIFNKQPVKALEEIKFSVNINRGCNGGCNFCAITFHQGKQISMRSINSCVNEASKMKDLTNFKGYIHDVGGPTANFNDDMCDKLNTKGSCKNRDCFSPVMCPNLKVDHSKYFSTLEQIRNIDGIKKVFVRSGIRYDYFIKEKNSKYLNDLVKYHVSGQLRLAPEHYSDNALRYMNKPGINVYDRFVEKFNKTTKELGLPQYVVPYLMSSHPGTTLEDALQLALYLKKINYRPVQVQDFYPTPSTMATVMYYTGLDPRSMKKVYSAKTAHDKALQRALLQFHLPQNYELVYNALKKLNRLDLVSNDGLIRKKKGNYNDR